MLWVENDLVPPGLTQGFNQKLLHECHGQDVDSLASVFSLKTGHEQSTPMT